MAELRRVDRLRRTAPVWSYRLSLSLLLASSGCERLAALDLAGGDPLSKRARAPLSIGERTPNEAEARVVGEANAPIMRRSPAFKLLVECEDGAFVFKDEEHNQSDRMMTPRLRRGLIRLSRLVSQTWPKLELRVTEAWDEEREHGAASVHYEGRAADITTSDQDPAKLGVLAALAIEAGLDWVFYESASHVHVSVRR